MTSSANLSAPGLDPPDGVVPDFNNTGRHTVGYAISVLGIIISTASVLPHLANRAMSRRFGLIEVFLIAAWGQYLGLQAIIWRSAAFGIERHQWNVPIGELPWYFYNIFVATLLYGTAMMCLKLAILLSWLDLFVPAGTRNRLYWAIHVLIWCNAIFFMVTEFADIFQCTPIRKNWDIFYEGGSCHLDAGAINLSGVVINLVSDLAILILPQWTLWHLHLPWRKRLGVSLLFAIGLGVCILGAMRFISLIPLADSEDLTFWMSVQGLYASGEIGLGFLVIGIPALPKVYNSLPVSESLSNLIRSLRSSTGRMTSGNHGIAHSDQGVPERRRRGFWTITELEETLPHSRSMQSTSRDPEQDLHDTHQKSYSLQVMGPKSAVGGSSM